MQAQEESFFFKKVSENVQSPISLRCLCFGYASYGVIAVYSGITYRYVQLLGFCLKDLLLTLIVYLCEMVNLIL